MADVLSQIADFWGNGRRPASDAEGVSLPKPVVEKLITKAAEKSKLETDMALPGVEIQAVSNKPAVQPVSAESQIQTLPTDVVTAQAPEGPENKYRMLNRIIGRQDQLAEQIAPPSDLQNRMAETFRALQRQARAPRRGLDIDQITQSASAKNPMPEWSNSDYLKAALVATLPSLAGAVAGGLAGAAGGSQGGIKGMELANRQDEMARKTVADKRDKTVANQIDAFKAETEARGKEIRTMADLVKLEVELYGKITEPTRKFLESAAGDYSKAEIDTYEQELRQQGDTERKLIGESGADSRENLREEGRNLRAEGARSTGERIANAKLNESQRQFDNRLLESQRQFDLGQDNAMAKSDKDRASREAMAKAKNALAAQVAKIKGTAAGKAAAAKPPNESQAMAASYGTRMADADVLIDRLYKTEMFNSTNRARMIHQFDKNDRLLSLVRNGDAQKYYNAVRNFVSAVLRKESGAAISESEFASAEKLYFPGPGDTSDTVEQKRENRRLAIAGMRAAAGDTATKNVQDQLKTGRKNDEAIQRYADQFRMTYEGAKKVLTNRGYKPNETVTYEK